VSEGGERGGAAREPERARDATDDDDDVGGGCG